MPQFCILFYANYTILATQRGAMAQWPPPKYAPVQQGTKIPKIWFWKKLKSNKTFVIT